MSLKKSIVNNQHFWIRMTSDKSDCTGVNTYHIIDYSLWAWAILDTVGKAIVLISKDYFRDWGNIDKVIKTLPRTQQLLNKCYPALLQEFTWDITFKWGKSSCIK